MGDLTAQDHAGDASVLEELGSVPVTFDRMNVVGLDDVEMALYRALIGLSDTGWRARGIAQCMDGAKTLGAALRDAAVDPGRIRWCAWPACMESFDAATGPAGDPGWKRHMGMTLLCPGHAHAGHTPSYVVDKDDLTQLTGRCSCGAWGLIKPSNLQAVIEWWCAHVVQTSQARPAPPHDDVAAGCGWVAEDAGPKWQLVSHPQIRCRHNPKTGQCPQRAVVELNRGRYVQATATYRDSWWAYCLEHAHGRWVEDGKVMTWMLRAVEGDGGRELV